MTNALSPNDSITSLAGVGEIIASKLSKLNIYTVGDLLRFIPSRYVDFSQKSFIKELKEGKTASFLGTIQNLKSFYTRSGKLLTQATAKDLSGTITLTWFNNPYIKKIILVGETYSIAGTVSAFGGKLTLISPTVEEGDSFSINTTGLVPIFPLTKGITSRWLRQKIYTNLPNIKITDPLTEYLKQNDLDLMSAYSKIHFPKTKLEKKSADKRLSFNQHLSINIDNFSKIKNLGDSPKIKFDQQVDKRGHDKLIFTLTPDQEKVTKHIYKDLQSNQFTHRLIQGDTGSGKTATLILAANQCLSQGFSCAIIAPTQILANQHADTFRKLSLFPDDICLITGNTNPTIPNKPAIFIGTHALLTKLPKNLLHPIVFIAVDEQHKFGVKQREQLQDRVPVPHLINLSATPIPRTVALGLLGDLKLSSIKFKPQNRLPVKTHVTTISYFSKSTKWLSEHLQNNNKIFIVCPNIYDQNNDTSSVQKYYLHYKKILPQNTPIFALHGQMKSEEQKNILNLFTESDGSVLVSTSLIEVGIDIPAANIMIIHSAERFGLAQLHQLRGRVGRGDTQSYCFLVPSTDDQIETERLKLLQKYSSGLTLAKKDLILRGAGEVFGEKQHGSLQTRLTYFWSKKSFLRAKKLAKQLILEDSTKALAIASSLKSC